MVQNHRKVFPMMARSSLESGDTSVDIGFLEEHVRGFPYRGEEVLSTSLLQKGGQVSKVVAKRGAVLGLCGVECLGEGNSPALADESEDFTSLLVVQGLRHLLLEAIHLDLRGITQPLNPI